MQFVVTSTGFEGAQDALARLWDIVDEVADRIGATVTQQVKDRIDSEKESPSGGEWRPWSALYAQSKLPGSMLEQSGALLTSIGWAPSPRGVVVGSNLPYAGVQQRMRPFLGLSSRNVDQLRGLVVEYAREAIS